MMADVGDGLPSYTDDDDDDDVTDDDDDDDELTIRRQHEIPF